MTELVEAAQLAKVTSAGVHLDLYGYSLADLGSLCRDLQVPEVHARALFRKLYKERSLNPWEAADLPKKLVQFLREKSQLVQPQVVSSHLSRYDQSVKFVCQFGGGARVEAVLMPEKKRLTLCLSTQVGCAQACVFCHTGRMGLIRQLSASEIVAQVMITERWIAEHPEWLAENRLSARQRVSNIVFMGMGEPLDNVEAVHKSMQVMSSPYGLAIGLGHISVSTAGHLSGLKRLLELEPNARIALSVHSVDDAQRSRIMPINKRWPLAKVIESLQELQSVKSPPVLFQYTLIHGVNDKAEDATKLAELALRLKAKINLIPLNDVSVSRLSAPSAVSIQEFRDILYAAGLRVMVRYSKGQDIAAACGQLIALG